MFNKTVPSFRIKVSRRTAVSGAVSLNLRLSISLREHSEENENEMRHIKTGKTSSTGSGFPQEMLRDAWFMIANEIHIPPPIYPTSCKVAVEQIHLQACLNK